MSLNSAFKGKLIKEVSTIPWRNNEQPIYILKEKTEIGWKVLVVSPGIHIRFSPGKLYELPDSFLEEYTDIYD